MDRGTMVPTRGIIPVLGRIVKRAADRGTPVLDVELVAGNDGTGAQCIISAPSAGDLDQATLAFDRDKGISRIDQRIGERNGEPAMLITISW